MRKAPSGFTLVEMMAVLAVLGILAAMAYPSMQYRIIQQQIASISPLTDIAKQPIQAAWTALQKMPADNAAAGLPSADKMVSNLVSNVAVSDGVITVTFGNQANGAIRGKILSIRPAVVEGAPMVPIAWVCGNAAVPDKMTARGSDQTTIPLGMLPMSCRNHGAAR
jgi:type IV pilus assembly protein PilA